MKCLFLYGYADGQMLDVRMAGDRPLPVVTIPERDHPRVANYSKSERPPAVDVKITMHEYERVQFRDGDASYWLYRPTHERGSMMQRLIELASK